VSRTDDDARLRRKFLESLSHAGFGDRELIADFDSTPECGSRGAEHSRQFTPSHLVETTEFTRLLEDVVGFLKRHAGAILDGTTGIQPVRYGSRGTACDYCDYKSFCRFDPIQGEFRPITTRPDAA
jgi:ATP-dependent helicase/DNAse subunit B